MMHVASKSATMTLMMAMGKMQDGTQGVLTSPPKVAHAEKRHVDGRLCSWAEVEVWHLAGWRCRERSEEGGVDGGDAGLELSKASMVKECVDDSMRNYGRSFGKKLAACPSRQT